MPTATTPPQMAPPVQPPSMDGVAGASPPLASGAVPMSRPAWAPADRTGAVGTTMVGATATPAVEVPQSQKSNTRRLRSDSARRKEVRLTTWLLAIAALLVIGAVLAAISLAR